jgi:putative nucleotidyltransferase with HDIG domain
LPLFLDETLALLGTDSGELSLYDPESRTLVQLVAKGWFKFMLNDRMALEEGLAGHVIATGKTHLAREFATDPLTYVNSLSHVPAGWGGICVPIRSAQEMLGVLFVGVPLPRELTSHEINLLTTFAEIAGNTIHRMSLHESLRETFLQTIAALAHAVDARDAYTANHSNAVADLAVLLGQAMQVSGEELEDLRLAGLLHDIGKMAIPDAILHKKSQLEPDEWQIVRQHPVTGGEILQSITALKNVVEIVRHHHEWFDGTGYPDRIAGEAIPFGARILTVADALSSIMDERSYRLPRTAAQALEEIELYAGRQFDPRVVAQLRILYEQKKL